MIPLCIIGESLLGYPAGGASAIHACEYEGTNEIDATRWLSPRYGHRSIQLFLLTLLIGTRLSTIHLSYSAHYHSFIPHLQCGPRCAPMKVLAHSESGKSQL
jgi:hypothetical protein